MTNSATPTEPRRRTPRRGALLVGALLVLGWGFVLAQYRLSPTAPAVVLGLAWMALVLGGWFLWRVSQSGRADGDDPELDDAAWFRPTGALGELALEKQSLLKAIKEIEFDHALGKMSDADAEAMERLYRGRAIEVIKAMDALAAGDGGGVRAEIERELRARLEVERKGKGRGRSKAKGKAAASAPSKLDDAASAEARDDAAPAEARDDAAPTEARDDAAPDASAAAPAEPGTSTDAKEHVAS
ncbi:MAG: hypothetical protein R2939_13540 [Kofleriaceae bacterium]